ncbi:BTAD domain-containing putative transcriptional regulator [Kutzneria sp. NPDC051319]|uniref:BTAD domain-containing putative transcriptional regulator n=1 Tax=Kutzneria sp. NPDC051319 TaxID=3155047 RepID=UPI003449920E
MRFNLLGPLEVRHEGQSVPLGGLNQRAALGFLLLHENRAVAISQLLEALWGERPPSTARKIIYNAVAGLRSALAADEPGPDAAVLATHAPGYMLRVRPDRIDVLEFQCLAERGRSELAQGNYDRSVLLLRQALGLWRGPVLADLAEAGVDWPQMSALGNARLAALEDCVEAQLALGMHHQVVTELEPLALSGPPRERMCAQLMLALYRCGRQADALNVYLHTRNHLVEDLGLDPSRQLRQLQQAILDHDPSLALTPAAARAPQTPAPRAEVEPALSTAERKLVSALLVDVPLSVHADDDPEDVETAQREVAAAVRAEVERFGGIVHNSVGTVHVAWFGVPKTAQDDAERAVRAALGINRRLATRPGLDGWHADAARVAVNTGEALVRPSRARDGQYDVVGALVDEGLRLLGRLAPGEFRVCATTMRTCEFGFVFAAADAADGGFELVRANDRPGDVVSTALIGRDREMGTLRDALAQVERSVRAQLVTVVGEPGIGKSRLVGEFCRSPHRDGSGVRVLTSDSRWAGEPGHLSALGAVVRSYLGVTEDDHAAEEKLTAAVHELVGAGHAGRWLASRMAPLLAPDPDAAPDGDRSEALIAFRRFMEEVAAREPVVVVFEDAHRYDDLLLEFLAELPSQALPVPMLVVVTCRPESSLPARWGGTRLELRALSDGDSVRLVEEFAAQLGLCGDKPGDTDSLTGGALNRFLSALLSRIGGVPLFAREYVRMLRDGHPSQRDTSPVAQGPGWLHSGDLIALPRTVHSVVAAMLDSLPALEKTILRDAAVVDGTVCVNAVSVVGGRSKDEVASALHSLVRRGILLITNDQVVAGQQEYAFHQVVVRDVAYHQLPRADRADRHARAAEWVGALPHGDPALAEHHMRLAQLPAATAARSVAVSRPVVETTVFTERETVDTRLAAAVAVRLPVRITSGASVPAALH